SVSTKKQGDFGIMLACFRNNTIRLSCYYAHCDKAPPFDCEFLLNGTRLEKTPSESCKNVIKQLPTNVTNYTCILTRRKREETKTIIIDPKAPDTSG
ncbi:hypothetical protein XENOCAPTIV_008668, partial [Xenoophorus captivus]